MESHILQRMHKGYILSGMASASKNAVGNQAETNYDKTSVSNKPKEAKMIAQILKTRAPFCTKANRYSAISTAING